MILNDIMKRYPPKSRDEIIAQSEDIIADIQAGIGDVCKLRDELFFLHIGLVCKIAKQNSGKLIEDDILTCCLECVLPAAERYDIDKGRARFTWVSFYLQRCQWRINEYYHRTTQMVYIPKAPWEGGMRFEYDYDCDIDSMVHEDDDSYPTRWKAVHFYEVNNKPFSKNDELDIVIFKLNYRNKNQSKIAKHLGVPRDRVKEGIERLTEKMRQYYSEYPFDFDR